MLTTNRNLLIVADMLIVHRGFAEQQPKMVAGLVQGLLEGNRMVRDDPTRTSTSSAGRSSGRATRRRAELTKVHLSNLPENLAFFSGAIDEAGSFGGIYQSAVLAYGSDLVKDPPSADRFVDLKHLQALEKTGLFKDQKIAIAPIRIGGGGVARDQSAAEQGHPLPVRAERGDARHVESRTTSRTSRRSRSCCRSARARRCCCAATSTTRWSSSSASRAARPTCAQQALRAMELSKNRAEEIKRLLVEKYQRRCEAPRRRRPRLGRAVGQRLGAEPPRRSAVVHD